MNARHGILTAVAALGVAACHDSTSPDAGPFRVVSVTPSLLAADVDPATPITVQFSRRLLISSVNDTTFLLTRGGLKVAATVGLSDDRQSVRINGGLGNNQFYTLAVQTGVRDESGEALDAPFVTAFSTARANASLADPRGDTFGAASKIPDVTSIAASQEASAVVIRIGFSGAVTPSTSGLPNALGGYIDIDVDQNAATGSRALTDLFGPGASPGRSGLGAEYVLPLWVVGGGDSAAVYSTATFAIAGRVKLSFADSSVSIRIPLSVLGGDDGNVNLAAVVGTMAEPTNIAPNSGHLTLGSAGTMATNRTALAQMAGPSAAPPAVAGTWGR